MNKVESIVNQISNADVITVDDGPLLHSCEANDVTGEADNDVLVFTWVDEEGLEFQSIINEGALAEATFTGNELHVKDTSGEDTTIKIFNLAPKNFE